MRQVREENKNKIMKEQKLRIVYIASILNFDSTSLR